MCLGTPCIPCSPNKERTGADIFVPPKSAWNFSTSTFALLRLSSLYSTELGKRELKLVPKLIMLKNIFTDILRKNSWRPCFNVSILSPLIEPLLSQTNIISCLFSKSFNSFRIVTIITFSLFPSSSWFSSITTFEVGCFIFLIVTKLESLLSGNECWFCGWWESLLNRIESISWRFCDEKRKFRKLFGGILLFPIEI